MPRPTSSTTVQRPDLGTLAYEYAIRGGAWGFVGLRVLPVFNTPKATGDYPVIPKEAFLRLPETARAPRTNYNREDFEFETGHFDCAEHGFEVPLDDSEINYYQGLYGALDFETIATYKAEDIILRSQEKRIADMVFNSATFSAHSVAVPWSNVTASNPIVNIQSAQSVLKATTGVMADSLVVSWKVFNNAIRSAAIADVLMYTNPTIVKDFEAQRALLSQVLGVEVIVGDAIYNSGKKGGTFTATSIWSTEFGMLFRRSSGGLNLMEPALGRTFLFTEDSPNIITVETYREEQTRGDIVRVRQNTDERFIFTGAGYLMANLT